MSERYLTADEAAERMGMELATLYRRRSDGSAMPPAIKFGGKLRFRESAVDAFLIAHEERLSA